MGLLTQLFRLRTLARSCQLLVANLLFTSEVVALCFSPLPQAEIDKYLASKSPPDYNHWANLIALKAPRPTAGVKRVLKLEDGVGQINLDYYELTFIPPAGKDLATLFYEIRQAYSKVTWGDIGSFIFKPYGNAPKDRISVNNLRLWTERKPENATMTFVLKTYRPVFLMSATLGGRKFHIKNGDVLAGCATETDFVFFTLDSKSGGAHPVSGRRGFGLKDNGNGTWTFYSMAADRRTNYKDELLSRYFEGEGIFENGHKFWLQFFPNLREHLISQGSRFSRDNFIAISNRYDYRSN